MTLHIVKPSSKAQKATRTTMQTDIFSCADIKGWELPPFQRQLKVNARVLAIAEDIKRDGGILPGVITLGILGDTKYLLDGQHRRAAFIESGCTEGIADLRICYFDDLAEMGEEFVRLNSSIVRMRADDTLRGLEGSMPAMALLRKKCPFVGYDFINRNTKHGPVVSMSNVLRVWQQSSTGIVATSSTQSVTLARMMTEEDANALAAFLRACFAAWGRDAEYARLWNSLNLSICAWLWRNMVTSKFSARSDQITADQFTKCLMSISADSGHIAWLMGRKLTDIDRSPAYARTKVIFSKRITADTGVKPSLPAPDWGGRSHLERGKV